MRRVLVIILSIIAIYVLGWIVYCIWPAMPWTVSYYNKKTDEYMTKKYDFEVERVDYKINSLIENTYYFFRYKKTDSPSEIISVTVPFHVHNIDEYFDSYPERMFTEKYREAINEKMELIFGESAEIDCSVCGLSTINVYLENIEKDHVVEISVHVNGNDKEKLAEETVSFVKSLDDMGINLRILNVYGECGKYEIRYPRAEISVDDLEYTEME